jgi:capsule polysaccharide export protein KpsE/RkpR
MKSIDLAWLIWNQRKFLGKLFAAGAILFAIIAFLIPNRYAATAQMMPPDFSSSADMISALPALSSGGDSAGGAGGSVMGLANKLLGLNSTGQLIVGVLRSQTIEDRIIQKFGLMDLYSEKFPEDARKKLEGYSNIKEDSQTGIISITVEDKSPARAAAIAQAYTDELNQILEDVNSSGAHRERQFIESRIKEVKARLDTSAKDFSVFASQNTAIDIPQQAKAMVEAAADLQAQLIAAESMLRGLQQIYTDKNPRVQQVQGQVTELEHQLDKIGGKDVKIDQGSSLPKGELYPSIRQLPLLGVQYLNLYRQSKIDEAVFELLSKEYELAKLEEARDTPSIHVLDQASIPKKKASPHRLLITVGGSFFCLVVGMSWLVAGAYWERVDPEEPWRIFAEEVHMSAKVRTWDSSLALRIRSRISGNARHSDGEGPAS